MVCNLLVGITIVEIKLLKWDIPPFYILAKQFIYSPSPVILGRVVCHEVKVQPEVQSAYSPVCPKLRSRIFQDLGVKPECEKFPAISDLSLNTRSPLVLAQACLLVRRTSFVACPCLGSN